jgi:transposase
MHSNPVPRRRHSAELKAKVLSACNEPGASIAAVALSHGLNANLVRKWLGGRGLKRTGIPAPVAVKTSVAAA